MCVINLVNDNTRYPPDGLLPPEHQVHDVADLYSTDELNDCFPQESLLQSMITDEINTMNTGDDDALSGLNGRLRPRKSNVPSSSNSRVRKSDVKSSPEQRPKRTTTPSKVTPNKQDDLATKSDDMPTLQLLCPYCDRKFITKQNLSKHVRLTHIPAFKQNTTIACLFCNHNEIEFQDIIQHMVDSHPNHYFACLDCNSRFNSTSELAEHKLYVCEKQKPTFSTKTCPKKPKQSGSALVKADYSTDVKEFPEGHGFNGIVISCELKPTQVHDDADIEDNITTNLILPSNKTLSNAVMDKNAVIVLDDIQWTKRLPPNFSFHNADADQILSRLGVVHKSPRGAESTKKDWFKILDEANQKFERCFDTTFYSKVASNVQENLNKFLDGSFNFNPDPDAMIKTRKSKYSVSINTAEGFPILLASEQFARNFFERYIPRTIAPKHKWKWDSIENARNALNPDQIKRDSHTNNCIVTLVSGLDIWTQLCMRRKFEEKFNNTPVGKKIEKQNAISLELKEILESRDLPSVSSKVVEKSTPKNLVRESPPSWLGLCHNKPVEAPPPAVLSGEWVRPRCYVCCACGAQTRDPRAVTVHINTHHPNAQVQHYEIVGDRLLKSDILRHLYVPPGQMVNRTRPLRGIRDCTKCNKTVSLEDLHQHMLECAGDSPTVRRKVRPRPFGTRRRRPRIPDNTIRKKIRKHNIREKHPRQKIRLRRTLPKVRSEVGDAETIRKMIADLPAKRHRVTLNAENSIIRPQRNIDKQQRNKLILKRRGTEELRNRRLRAVRNALPSFIETPVSTDDNNQQNQEEESNLPKPRTPRMSTRRMEALKASKQKVFAARPHRIPTRMHGTNMSSEAPDGKNKPGVEQIDGNKEGDQPIDESQKGAIGDLPIDNSSQRADMSGESSPNRRQQGGRGTPTQGGRNNPIDNIPQRINMGESSSSGRQHGRRGTPTRGGRGGPQRSGDGWNGGGDDPVRNDNNDPSPQRTPPLKHSIARLCGNLETHDKSVQFQPMFLIQQECNNAPHHVPTGQQLLFENEAVVTKLDKPPINDYKGGTQERPNNVSSRKKQRSSSRKGLSACIAMLKTKLVEPAPVMNQEHVSVQCGNDESLKQVTTPPPPQNPPTPPPPPPPQTPSTPPPVMPNLRESWNFDSPTPCPPINSIDQVRCIDTMDKLPGEELGNFGCNMPMPVTPTSVIPSPEIPSAVTSSSVIPSPVVPTPVVPSPVITSSVVPLPVICPAPVQQQSPPEPVFKTPRKRAAKACTAPPKKRTTKVLPRRESVRRKAAIRAESEIQKQKLSELAAQIQAFTPKYSDFCAVKQMVPAKQNKSDKVNKSSVIDKPPKSVQKLIEAQLRTQDKIKALEAFARPLEPLTVTTSDQVRGMDNVHYQNFPSYNSRYKTSNRGLPKKMRAASIPRNTDPSNLLLPADKAAMRRYSLDITSQYSNQYINTQLSPQFQVPNLINHSPKESNPTQYSPREANYRILHSPLEGKVNMSPIDESFWHYQPHRRETDVGPRILHSSKDNMSRYQLSANYGFGRAMPSSNEMYSNRHFEKDDIASAVSSRQIQYSPRDLTSGDKDTQQSYAERQDLLPSPIRLPGSTYTRSQIGTLLDPSTLDSRLQYFRATSPLDLSGKSEAIDMSKQQDTKRQAIDVPNYESFRTKALTPKPSETSTIAENVEQEEEDVKNLVVDLRVKQHNTHLYDQNSNTENRSLVTDTSFNKGYEHNETASNASYPTSLYSNPKYCNYPVEEYLPQMPTLNKTYTDKDSEYLSQRENVDRETTLKGTHSPNELPDVKFAGNFVDSKTCKIEESYYDPADMTLQLSLEHLEPVLEDTVDEIVIIELSQVSPSPLPSDDQPETCSSICVPLLSPEKPTCKVLENLPEDNLSASFLPRLIKTEIPEPVDTLPDAPFALTKTDASNMSTINERHTQTTSITNTSSEMLQTQNSSTNVSQNDKSTMEFEKNIKPIDNEQDPEVAKKIELLPKELVEIIGNMPPDHRNKLLNILPQYVSTSTSIQEKVKEQAVTVATANAVISAKPLNTVADYSSTKSESANAISAQRDIYSSVQDTIKNEHSFNVLKETKDPTVRLIDQCPLKVPDYKIMQNNVIDLTKDDPPIIPTVTVSPETNLTNTVPIFETTGNTISITPKTKLKSNNEQTASLRAVRIKTAVERHKTTTVQPLFSEQSLQVTALERLKTTNINSLGNEQSLHETTTERHKTTSGNLIVNEKSFDETSFDQHKTTIKSFESEQSLSETALELHKTISDKPLVSDTSFCETALERDNTNSISPSVADTSLNEATLDRYDSTSVNPLASGQSFQETALERHQPSITKPSVSKKSMHENSLELHKTASNKVFVSEQALNDTALEVHYTTSAKALVSEQPSHKSIAVDNTVQKRIAQKVEVANKLSSNNNTLSVKSPHHETNEHILVNNNNNDSKTNAKDISLDPAKKSSKDSENKISATILCEPEVTTDLNIKVNDDTVDDVSIQIQQSSSELIKNVDNQQLKTENNKPIEQFESLLNITPIENCIPLDNSTPKRDKEMSDAHQLQIPQQAPPVDYATAQKDDDSEDDISLALIVKQRKKTKVISKTSKSKTTSGSKKTIKKRNNKKTTLNTVDNILKSNTDLKTLSSKECLTISDRDEVTKKEEDDVFRKNQRLKKKSNKTPMSRPYENIPQRLSVTTTILNDCKSHDLNCEPQINLSSENKLEYIEKVVTQAGNISQETHDSSSLLFESSSTEMKTNSAIANNDSTVDKINELSGAKQDCHPEKMELVKEQYESPDVSQNISKDSGTNTTQTSPKHSKNIKFQDESLEAIRTEELDGQKNKSIPLRRSKRGKSLSSGGSVVKAPLTKKQLIFSKLLHDESCKLSKETLNIEPENDSVIDVTDSYEDFNSTTEHENPQLKQNVIKSTKRKNSSQSTQSNKKNKFESTSDILPEVLDNKITEQYNNVLSNINLPQEENVLQKSDSKSKNVVIDNNSKATAISYKVEDKDTKSTNTKSKTLPSAEKRKTGINTIEDSIQEPKKIKTNKVDIESKGEIEEKYENKQIRSTCYSQAVSAIRRARTKSIVYETSISDTYDPYDINLDEMIENSEPCEKKKTKSKVVKHSKGVTKTKEVKAKKFEKTVNSKEDQPKTDYVDADSDSSQSDIPLKKYVKDKEILSNKRHKLKFDSKLDNRKSNDSIPNKEAIQSEPTDTDEQRSEQFMESFGFFSERKPRKSNLLATKKISETFHIIESEEYDTKKREEKKKLNIDTKKHKEGAKTAVLISTPKQSTSVKEEQKNETKIACYCEYCKKLFSRPDNYHRHQFSKDHISKLANIEFNFDTNIKLDGSNHLVIFKQKLDKHMQQNLDKNNQESNKNQQNPPILKDILDKVFDIVKEEELRINDENRDEILFSTCCKLLKEYRQKSAVKLYLDNNTISMCPFEPTNTSQSNSKIDEVNDPNTSKNVLAQAVTDDLKIGLQEQARNKLKQDQQEIYEKSTLFGTLLDISKIRALCGADFILDNLPILTPPKRPQGPIAYSDKIMVPRRKIAGGQQKPSKSMQQVRSGKHRNISAEIVQNKTSKDEPKPSTSRHAIAQMNKTCPQDAKIAKLNESQPKRKRKKTPKCESKPGTSKKLDKNETKPNLSETVLNNSELEEPVKYPEYKEKMYPDIIIEDIDMLEDKFDKIKRKCRSQAAAAKQTSTVVECTSIKSRKKSDKKKIKKKTKKSHHSSTVLTKGALKGFDGIKVSIPTYDINMSAVVRETTTKKKKKSSSKKKREQRLSVSSNKHDSDHRGSNSSQKKVDVYEFMDNEDAELFEFRPSTLMERFKSMCSKDNENISEPRIATGDVDVSSESGSDEDDFVYMSDDYVCSDDETENSLLSCELGNNKHNVDAKKSPVKRKETVDKSAVMGKIFKNNAVRSDKKSAKSKETAKSKTNLDQLFDSLLKSEQDVPGEEETKSKVSDEVLTRNEDENKSEESATKTYVEMSTQYEPLLIETEVTPPKKDETTVTKSVSSLPVERLSTSTAMTTTSRRNTSISPRIRAATPKKIENYSLTNSPIDDSYATISQDMLDDIHEPSTSRKYSLSPPKEYKHMSRKLDFLCSSFESSRNHGRTNRYDDFPPREAKEYSHQKHPKKSARFESPSKDEASTNEMVEDDRDDAGVARQRVRRKCTVGKQNVLAESWSSESDADGAPRPTSAASVAAAVVRKKKAKRRDTASAGRRKSQALSKKVEESRLGAPSSIDWPADTEEHVQQHGWIVGDSHKKLVTMLAHAKGRKRTSDDDRNDLD